jgi:hypothetical protein
MPRACPVEIHVRRYTDFAQPAKLDATGLPRSRFTFAATPILPNQQNWMPRACPVETSMMNVRS